MGTERSLKSAVVSLFVEGVLEIEGDEKGTHNLCVYIVFVFVCVCVCLYVCVCALVMGSWFKY